MAEQNIWLSDFFPQVDQGILLGSILYDENAIQVLVRSVQWHLRWELRCELWYSL